MAEAIRIETRLESRIPEFIVHVDAVSRAAVKSTADAIARDMRQLAPVDSGDMVDSIGTESIALGIAAAVSIGVDYWMYPNYGTRYQAAQPFVEPAVDQHLDDLPEKILVGIEGF
jgi:HK97 gp10 family phage protein